MIKAEKPLTRKQAYDKALVHVSKFQLHNVLKKIPDGMMGVSPPPGFKMPYPEDNPIYHVSCRISSLRILMLSMSVGTQKGQE